MAAGASIGLFANNQLISPGELIARLNLNPPIELVEVAGVGVRAHSRTGRKRLTNVAVIH